MDIGYSKNVKIKLYKLHCNHGRELCDWAEKYAAAQCRSILI